MSRLHARLAALLALSALLAFVSGAGLEARSVVPAAAILALAVFVQPGERAAQLLEPIWRIAALLLSARAAWVVFAGRGDPVLAMVDLLLLLLCAESLRPRDGSGDARHFALTVALLIAAAAYRPGPAFGLLFAVYVVCAVLTLVVGHLSRQSVGRGFTPPRPRLGFLARIAGFGLAVVAASVLLFLFFPRTSPGWAARSTPLPASAAIGFSDRVSIGEHGARLEPNPEVVLRVEFPGGAPLDVGALYWRGRAYDHFDGSSWSRAGRAPSLPTAARRWPGGLIDQHVYARPLTDANVVFGLHPILTVTPHARIRAFRAGSDDFMYSGAGEPVYAVRSRAGQPHPDSLRAAEVRYSPDVMAQLQLPQVSRELLALADSFRAAAATPYDQAVAIEQWLRTFRYTLDLPDSPAEATLHHFLFRRRAGHCEYFSTAMAVLLRAGGVPARNVNGFLGGEWNEFGGFLNVTQNNAHSWVEVWFTGWGWVPFDPTPPGAAAAAAGVARMPWHRLFAGLEHRWGKWVLDYGVGSQTSLFGRAENARAERRTEDGETAGGAAALPALLWLTVLALAVLGVIAIARRRAGRAATSSAYLRLRRAYARAGIVAEGNLPPLAFAAAVHDRVGGEHAVRAVELYLRDRFAADALSAGDRAALESSVAAARRALRRGRQLSSASGSDEAGRDGRADGGGLRSFG